jgi:nucleoid-associated protein YgaU
MYALRTDHPRIAPLHRWHPAESLLWRARWAVLALTALSLLSAGYASLVDGPAPSSRAVAGNYVAVTVAPGDTLWGIASRRYPSADVRRKVFEIEQLNGLRGPAIEAGQLLKVPGE